MTRLAFMQGLPVTRICSVIDIRVPRRKSLLIISQLPGRLSNYRESVSRVQGIRLGVLYLHFMICERAAEAKDLRILCVIGEVRAYFLFGCVIRLPQLVARHFLFQPR